jgi:hypothetical protein
MKKPDNLHLKHQLSSNLYRIKAKDIPAEILPHCSTLAANIIHFFNFAFD